MVRLGNENTSCENLFFFGSHRGKPLSPHKVEPGIFRNVMLRLWESRNCTEIRNVGLNLFSFRFASAKDKELVLRSGPWIFNRHLLALNSFDLAVNPASIPVTRVPIWVQAHGLPYTLRTERMARSLGEKFGGFLEWDKYEARRYGVSLRIRVWLDITAPLRRGQMVAVQGGAPVRVSFKYEKIVNFCFRCGMVDHVLADCVLPDDGSPNRYGLWIRGETEKRRGARRDGGKLRLEEEELQEEYEEDAEENHAEEDAQETRESGNDTGKKSVEEELVTKPTSADDKHEPNAKLTGTKKPEEEVDNNRRPGKAKAGTDFIFGSQRVHGNNSPWKRQPRSGARGVQIREGGGAHHEDDHRKRSSVSSSLPGPNSTGFSPPLKKKHTDSGLGLAGSAKQPRPPQ
ncbi:uncharacterized protein LOC130737012 [Lotus japonicus]|uniref:uncharacterized protein LOC130737012 n=1 Tax=Lotus japonicus TaxID=34305 RepID=UPI00258FFCAC|nr:uncharacterized protein LOC130737012 [Lotus japonicus]